MCELLLAVWPEPKRSDEVLAWATGLERFGVGGFGWGLAWRDGVLVRHYRNPGRLSE
jgi:predicted glutamine amidotransferase